MQVRELLHNLFSKTLSFMHVKRLSSLLDAVQGLLIGKKLSLSHLARHLPNLIKERHCIRKMDRLLGNKHLHAEIKSIYHAHCMLLIKNITNPIISVDWSTTDKRRNWHILRASLNINGRGFVLYQEVHSREKSNSRYVQNSFLDKLKVMLPSTCKPIIVADAGFRFPWFKKIREIGFDYVGRIRQKTFYQPIDSKIWQKNCLTLYEKATCKAKFLGKMLFTREIDFASTVILYKKKKKGRTHINRSGYQTNNTESNRCARRQNDPWLLVTSLEINSLMKPDKIVTIYAKRMQIEEDFRDTKSHRYGFGLRYSLSNSAKRIEVLLLIAALASLFCWLIALSARKKNLHLDYQSNTIKDRNVLSVIYLGCQLVRRNEFFSIQALKEAYFIMQNLILETALC